MSDDWQRHLERWADAGVIDTDTVERVRTFERSHPHDERLSWPIRLALVFGAVALGAGVLLFVSAHWDGLPPASRFSLVLLLTAVFHVGGGAASSRQPALATALHAIGTLALGASIFLTGQIFHLDERWPAGFMLWALGAVIAWLLLRDLPQCGLSALLVPLWLSTEWVDATAALSALTRDSSRVLAVGLFLTSLSYFTCLGHRTARPRLERYRSLLVRIGTIALVPTAALLAVIAYDIPGERNLLSERMGPALHSAGWLVALVLPLGLSIVTRRRHAWIFGVAVAWVIMLWPMSALGALAPFGWWALGSIGLVGWGLMDSRTERINMGAVVFGSTVLAFYFSQVMDKLGRSASLIVVGVLFLGGGAALERMRRRLVTRAKEDTR